MAAKTLIVLIIQTLILKAYSQNMFPVQKYIQITGLGSNPPSAGLTNIPSVGSSSSSPLSRSAGIGPLSGLSLPSIASILSSKQLLESVPGLQALLASKSASSPVTISSTNLSPTNVSPIQIQTNPTAQANTPAGNVDATLLNNLAIAMQLLILSNILNAPPESESVEAETPFLEFESFPPTYSSSTKTSQETYTSSPSKAHKESFTKPKYEKNYYENEPSIQVDTYSESISQKSMPNANFVGSSTFGGTSLPSYAASPYGVTTPTNPRSGMSLMSPYEALSPSSPFSDPILSSSYGSMMMTSKKGFSSPYSMMDDKDLFTIY